jgi:hypothetical protein
MDGMGTATLCEQGSCMLPADVQFPCAHELVGLLDCALGLSDLCAPDGSELDEANALECRDSVQAYERCSDSISIDGPGSDSDP